MLDELERSDDVTVVRMRENGGPSRARNAALERVHAAATSCRSTPTTCCCRTRSSGCVEQLRGAGEQVGFIYPNLQYFGNREDYFEAPDWNLYALLQRNYCDVCSLFDRDVFDAGERFDESIRLGHEDWEFVLRLAARGVRGEPRAAARRCATASPASTAPTRSSTARRRVPRGRARAPSPLYHATSSTSRRAGRRRSR